MTDDARPGELGLREGQEMSRSASGECSRGREQRGTLVR
jgi:hypothetical protein